MEPALQSRFDLATEQYALSTHTSCVSEAWGAMHNRSVRAVVVSPAMIALDDMRYIGRLVAAYPGVAAVAVLGKPDAQIGGKLLALGGYGVRQFVDLSNREGLDALRVLLARPEWDVGARILEEFLLPLEDPNNDARLFFGTVVRVAPYTKTSRQLAAVLNVHPSSLISRFYRAGLPSPKQYLAAVRLLYAVALLEENPGLTVTALAHRLDYSSPQSFGRHVRERLRVRAGRLAIQCPFDDLLAHYVYHLAKKFSGAFQSFGLFGSMVSAGI